jgi:hypothetical protein
MTGAVEPGEDDSSSDRVALETAATVDDCHRPELALVRGGGAHVRAVVRIRPVVGRSRDAVARLAVRGQGSIRRRAVLGVAAAGGGTGAWGVGLSVGLVVVGALSFVAGPSSTFSGARFRRSRRSPVMPGPASSRR